LKSVLVGQYIDPTRTTITLIVVLAEVYGQLPINQSTIYSSVDKVNKEKVKKSLVLYLL